MSHCLISLGSNQGDRQQILEQAIRQLAQCAELGAVQHSRWYETKPVGGPAGQSLYLNGAALFQTAHQPLALLAELQAIEHRLGRRRQQRWGPRTLDLDLLLYDDLTLQTPDLVLPHPRMAWRRFVLEPAAEIAPDMLHPPTRWTIAQLWQHLTTAANYVAITGTIAAGKTLLAQQLAAALPARLVAETLDPDRLNGFYANSASQAWPIELEFLRQRTELLSDDSPDWADRASYSVSDFWFDQSLAFATCWLPSERLPQYRSQWELARQRVVKPKLIVLLEPPIEQLQRRVRQGSHRGEQDLSAETFEQIHQAILQLATRPNQGPQLRLTNEDPASTLEALLAVVRSMR